jgi:hypothetical protein
MNIDEPSIWIISGFGGMHVEVRRSLRAALICARQWSLAATSWFDGPSKIKLVGQDLELDAYAINWHWHTIGLA